MFDLSVVGAWAGWMPALTALAFGAGVLVVASGRDGRWAAALTVVATSLSALLGLIFLVAAARTGAEGLAKHPLIWTFDWAPTGASTIRFGWLLDPLSISVAAMVAFVCLMIFVFATGYMNGEHTAYRDPETGEPDRRTGNARYGRFFAFCALFATGMMGFVLASNLLQALIFWEIMGLCSFLLIGFWYHKPSAAAAAVKAFLTTRLGDLFLLAGILVLFGTLGSVDYAVLLSPQAVERLRQLGPVPGTSLPFATLIGLLIFGGAVGKSAQFPLHVWLPDAMEGPTPVSALIHAATMVAAGVFLIARTYPVFSAWSLHAPGDISGAMFVVAAVGAFTAIFAASIGVAQFDIKRVLAYSTVSQLGYMVMALGIGAYVAAVFHLITHAFFKALLFLASGSVIHGLEHGFHHAQRHADLAAYGDEPGQPPPTSGWAAEVKDPAQDMRNMGGLRPRMPLTFVAFLAGTLALTGIPIFAGFWSKDEILAEAFAKGVQGAIGIAALVWLLGTVAAVLTAFYMARQTCLVFAGPPRTLAARHAPESEPAMVYPLLVLAFFATFLGLLGVPETFPVIGPWLHNPVHRFLAHLPFSPAEFHPLPFHGLAAALSVAAAVLGWLAGWQLYGRDPHRARLREPLESLGRLWRLLHAKYYVDELYAATIVPWLRRLSEWTAGIDVNVVDRLVNGGGIVGAAISRLSNWLDLHVVDAAVNASAAASEVASRGLRQLQTGRVQQYLLILFAGLLCLLATMAF